MKDPGSSIKKPKDRRDLFVFIHAIMRIAAMFELRKASRSNRLNCALGVVYVVYEIFNYFVCAHIAILYMCTVYIYYDNGDLEYLVNCLIQTIIYVWTISMKLYFRRFRHRLLNEIVDLCNDKHQICSAEGLTHVTVEEALRKSNLWIKSYVYCCFMGTIFWLALPIIYKDGTLPLACWYPFDYTRPIIYETIFVLQAIGQIQVAAAFASSSGFHMILSILISGQFDMLFCSLKNVFATSYLKMGAGVVEFRKLIEAQSTADSELNQYSYSIEFKTSLKKLYSFKRSSDIMAFRNTFRHSLIDCLHQHQYVLKIFKKMESFYNPIWLFKIGEVTFLMCLVAFVSTKSTSANSVMRMMSLGQYLLLVLYELFIICYFADVLHQTSQRCGDALWRSPWHIHTSQLSSDFIIFLIISRRSVQLTAGKIFNLNVDRFRSTITTAFSFLTLLQKMDARG